MENRKLQWGYYGIEIQWEYDDGDVSYLGKPTSTRGEYMVDRKRGVLLGSYAEATVTLKWADMPNAKMEEDSFSCCDETPDSATWVAAEQRIAELVKATGIDEGDNSDYTHTVDFDHDKMEFWAEVSGYKILADNLGRTMGWREYRYFDLEGNHLPHNPRNWAHVTGESLAKVIAKDGSVEKADIRYALEDWKRWEKYDNNDWSMMGCVVTIYKDNVEIAESSLWGIESDGGEDHLNAEIEAVLDGALNQAGLSISAKTVLAEAKEWEGNAND